MAIRWGFCLVRLLCFVRTFFLFKKKRKKKEKKRKKKWRLLPQSEIFYYPYFLQITTLIVSTKQTKTRP